MEFRYFVVAWITGLFMHSGIANSADTDADGIPDAEDNCIFVPNGPLEPDAGGNVQLDADGDGYGNYCDPDFDGDLVINATDLAFMKTKFFTPDSYADLDGSGVVNSADLAILKTMFFQEPGPSGLASTEIHFTNEEGGYSVVVPNGWYANSGVSDLKSAYLLPLDKVVDPSQEYVGDIFISVKHNPDGLDLAMYYQSLAEINLLVYSSAQIPLIIGGLNAFRFEGVPGMLPSVIVAVQSGDFIYEIKDFNESHQADGVFDEIVSSFTMLQ